MNRRAWFPALSLLWACYADPATHAVNQEAEVIDDESDANVPDASLDADIKTDGAADGKVDAGPCMCGEPGCSDAGCLECSDKVACGNSEPVCNNGQCRGCTKPADCTGRAGALICQASSGACVECTAEEQKACTDAGKVCKTNATQCVECNVSADCKGAAKPICEANVCRPCAVDNDCSPMGKVCNQSNGQCVACKPNKDAPEQENCSNGESCNPQTFACTAEPRRSLGFCGRSNDTSKKAPIRCVTDSECIEGHRCVQTNFPQGMPYGTYCLRQIGSQLCPNRAAVRRQATSTLGVTDFYCFPNDKYTTCEGVLSFRDACTLSDECGRSGVSDGRCESQRCTYGCDSNVDCTGSNNCIGPQEAPYCNPN